MPYNWRDEYQSGYFAVRPTDTVKTLTRKRANTYAVLIKELATGAPDTEILQSKKIINMFTEAINELEQKAAKEKG